MWERTGLLQKSNIHILYHAVSRVPKVENFRVKLSSFQTSLESFYLSEKIILCTLHHEMCVECVCMCTALLLYCCNRNMMILKNLKIYHPLVKVVDQVFLLFVQVEFLHLASEVKPLG